MKEFLFFFKIGAINCFAIFEWRAHLRRAVRSNAHNTSGAPGGAPKTSGAPGGAPSARVAKRIIANRKLNKEGGSNLVFEIQAYYIAIAHLAKFDFECYFAGRQSAICQTA